MKILFFKAPWCSACHAIEKHVPEDVEHVDCDESPEMANQYKISHLPVFLAVRDDGSEIARIATTSMPALESWRKKLDG